jgi:hypothetical protein
MTHFFKVCPSGRFAQTMKDGSFQIVAACEGLAGEEKESYPKITHTMLKRTIFVNSGIRFPLLLPFLPVFA